VRDVLRPKEEMIEERDWKLICVCPWKSPRRARRSEARLSPNILTRPEKHRYAIDDQTLTAPVM